MTSRVLWQRSTDVNVAFVYLYETAHRHVTEGSNFYRRIVNDVMSIQSTTINDKTVDNI